jgi:hypothetical protein
MQRWGNWIPGEHWAVLNHIKTAIDHYRVPDPVALRVKALAEIKDSQALGIPMVEHEGPAFVARVNHGSWLADCPCGGAAAIHPEWDEARCLGCGAFGKVLLPENWREIEAVLLKRPRPENRNWTDETVDALTVENMYHMEGVT